MPDNSLVIIPESSPVHKQFIDVINNSKLVIFSGLPGVGKSLYIREFCRIAGAHNKHIKLIQWDVARKAFETDYIMSHYPMGEGTVHNGLKIIAGRWLMRYVKSFIKSSPGDDEILLIEAPLVGNRFSELVHPNADAEVEQFLSSEMTSVVVPIPTSRVRNLIEAERARQVSEDAKVWSGAKPSVMLMLWKDTCAIANSMGMDIDLNEQPPYSEGIYEFVYSEILKHRNFEALIIDEVFEVPEMDESFLHSEDSIKADSATADLIAKEVVESMNNEEIDEIVEKWFQT